MGINKLGLNDSRLRFFVIEEVSHATALIRPIDDFYRERLREAADTELKTDYIESHTKINEYLTKEKFGGYTSLSAFLKSEP